MQQQDTLSNMFYSQKVELVIVSWSILKPSTWLIEPYHVTKFMLQPTVANFMYAIIDARTILLNWSFYSNQQLGVFKLRVNLGLKECTCGKEVEPTD